MKAHGIAGNNGAARSGSAGPSEPSTPANRKVQPASRPSTNKKRKLAARGHDLDEQVKTEVKTEVKAEVKDEPASSNNTDGSYMMHPSDPCEAATRAPARSGEVYKHENPIDHDGVLLVSDSQRDYSGPAAPIAFVQQMLVPPRPEGFYGFIDPTSDMHLLSPTSHPFAHGHEADYPKQTMAPTEPAVGLWLQHHQNTSFF